MVPIPKLGVIALVPVLSLGHHHLRDASAFVAPRSKVWHNNNERSTWFSRSSSSSSSRSRSSSVDIEASPSSSATSLNAKQPQFPIDYEEKNGTVATFAWLMPNDPDYIHPERQEEFPVGQLLKQKYNVGIALSGGGMRAASCTLGWLRALHSHNLLQNSRYLSANSGATWVTVPLAARQFLYRLRRTKPFPYDYYLGNYTPPEEIQGHDTELGRIGAVLAASNILVSGRNDKAQTGVQQPPDDDPTTVEDDVDSSIINTNTDDPSGFFAFVADTIASITKPVSNLFDPQANFTAWVEAIDENFVKPIRVPSSSARFYNQVLRAYLEHNFTDNGIQASEFPFPIYVATAYPDGDQPGIAVPFEFTPLYSGIPLDPRNFNHTNFMIGGGHTQYHVFNSNVTDPNTKNITWSRDGDPDYEVLRLPVPKKTLNIAEVTGISSSFFGAAVVQLGFEERLVNFFLKILPFVPYHAKNFPNPTTYQYWSPASGGTSRPLAYVDGGLYDNTGVLALLRRKCKCIIACVAADAAVAEDDPEKAAQAIADIAALFGKQETAGIETFIKKAAFLVFGKPPFPKRVRVLLGPRRSRLLFKPDGYLGSLFGPPEKGEDWNKFEAKKSIPSPNDFKVFHGEDWERLVSALASRYKEGEPQVVKLTLDVKENANAGVFGNSSVDLIVCLNGRVTASWHDRLMAKDLKSKITPSSPYDALKEPFPLLSLKSRTKLSPYFPYFSTFRVVYDNESVNMMAHLSSFALKRGLEKIEFDASEYKD